MSPKALTHTEAVDLCSRYQRLCGAPFNDQSTIDLVTVAPYKVIQQALYLQRLLNDESEKYDGPEICPEGMFDVVIISFPAATEDAAIMKPLRDYLRDFAPMYGVAVQAFIPGDSPDLLNRNARTHYLN